MNGPNRIGVFFLCFSCLSIPSFAQLSSGPALVVAKLSIPAGPGASQPADAKDNHLFLDVVVTDKSGKPVRGLQANDFQVLDNNSPQKLLSFQAAAGGNVAKAAAPVEIILLIDEVNTSFDRLSIEREQIKKFLQQNGGKLPQPVTLAYFSDNGTQILSGSSQDGNRLLASFDQHVTPLRSITGRNGAYGVLEQVQRSLDTLNSLAARETPKPGRKMVIWMSSGWPTLSGAIVALDKKRSEELFSTVVSVSNSLRTARITLYSIDPTGQDATTSYRGTAYRSFLQPVKQAKSVEIGNLALQVLALHSGGLALNSSNDIAGQINQCVADANSFYTLTAALPQADHPDQYRALEVKVSTPEVAVRTLSGYYGQP
jgi:VWFA-related protein